MDENSLDNLLNLEDNYYQEGYDLGRADGAHVGLVEGKLFGIEKGLEKALSLGRLSGRAEVWRRRFQSLKSSPSRPAQVLNPSNQGIPVQQVQVASALGESPVICASELPPLSANTRLGKHIENLSSTADSASLSSRNSDEAVAEYDERLMKAMAKAKVITNIIAEPLHVQDAANKGQRSIEESGDLSARH